MSLRRKGYWFNQSILKEISPGCSLEGLMLKLKLQYFGAVGSQVRDEWTTAAAAAAAAKPLQSCPTLCDPIDGSPLGSSVPGILQARILEWVNNDKFTYLSNPLICNQSPNPPTKESSALWQPQGPPTQKGSGRASGLTLWLHSIVSVLWCSQELFTLSLIIFFFLKKFYWSTVDL